MLSFIYKRAQALAPRLSLEDKQILKTADPWWEADILTGSPDWLKLKNLRLPRLKPDEQAFLENETEVLCSLLNDWQIHEEGNLPQAVWNYLAETGFFILMLPKCYGGKGFSASLYSAVIMKVASRNLASAITLTAAGFCAPAELLRQYGTERQKELYLPGLASGRDIPCLAGENFLDKSIKASEDYGMVCRRVHEGVEALGVKLSFSKEGVMLAPVATLIILSCHLYDPEHLLGEKHDLGINLFILKRQTPGLIIGNRHLVLDQAFMSGTLEAHELFVPIEALLGEESALGRGHEILLAGMALDRALGVPALSAAQGVLSFMNASAYTALTQVLNPVQSDRYSAELAKVSGFNYLLDACRLFTLCPLDQQQKPWIAASIAKYHMSEIARNILNIAMDLKKERGLMMGPGSELGRAYQNLPLLINMNRNNLSLSEEVIFRQGILLDHPGMKKLMESLNTEAAQGKKDFCKALLSCFSHGMKNLWNRIWMGCTRGLFIETPDSRLTREYRKVSLLSNRLALLTDVALLVLGRRIKSRKRLLARLGDAMSQLYMASAVLKYYQNFYEPEGEEVIARWAVQYCLGEAYQALHDFIRNFARGPLRSLVKYFILPWRRGYQIPGDRMDQNVAQFITEAKMLRERFQSYCYVDKNEPFGPVALERSYQALQRVLPLLEKINAAAGAKKWDSGLSFSEQLEKARELVVLTALEWQELDQFRQMREEIFAFDVFTMDLRLSKRSKINLNISLETQFTRLVEELRAGKISFNPTPAEKLELYGLYQQATVGDVNDSIPQATDFIARAKFQAWENYKGLTRQEAMQRYIDMFN